MHLKLNEERKFSRKARLLAPFLKRYREKADLQRLAPPLQTVLTHTLQTDNGKLLFVKNSKAGCTSVAQLLYHYSKGEYCEGPIHIQAENFTQGKSHWRKNLLALNDKDVVKFTLVRHPQARAISAFKDFFLEKNNPSAPRHIEAARYFGFSEDAEPNKNFDAFLNYVEACFKQDIRATDRHFRLQKINIGFGYVNYDIIGRLENLETDLLRVFKLVGADTYFNDHTKLRGFNRSKTSKKFELTSTQKNRIETLYRPDYEAFNY